VPDITSDYVPLFLEEQTHRIS